MSSAPAQLRSCPVLTDEVSGLALRFCWADWGLSMWSVCAQMGFLLNMQVQDFPHFWGDDVKNAGRVAGIVCFQICACTACSVTNVVHQFSLFCSHSLSLLAKKLRWVQNEHRHWSCHVYNVNILHITTDDYCPCQLVFRLFLEVIVE